MAAPSNIRINPFIGDGGTTNYVDFTEVHIIPAVSPFVVRLNEVPQKKDPSNMKVVYVDETTGAPTTTVLTEVAATPGAGEFRPDYSTNADGDEDWNTGLIEFSSADAGKSIQVSYTGMGTLAGVKNNRFPAWWLDRGDGSDGDFRPTGNTTISGLKQYRSVFIPAGVTISVNRFVRIKCQGMFVNNGIIREVSGVNSGGSGASSNGGAGGNGTIGTSSNGGAGGSGYRGYGGGAGGAFLSALDSTQDLTYYGGTGGGGGAGGNGSEYAGAGGNGGRGGGSIQIIASETIITGTIAANGYNGSAGVSAGVTYPGGGGGGGGGGSVIIISCSIKNSGVATANGGSGGSAGYGAGAGAAGGAGIVFIKELGVL